MLETHLAPFLYHLSALEQNQFLAGRSLKGKIVHHWAVATVAEYGLAQCGHMFLQVQHGCILKANQRQLGRMSSCTRQRQLQPLILARHSRVKNVFTAQQMIKNKFITVLECHCPVCSEPLSSFASGRLKVIHARSDCHLACCLVITTLALVAVLKFNSSAPGAGERFGDKKCKICFSARLPQSSGFILTFAYYSFLVL